MNIRLRCRRLWRLSDRAGDLEHHGDARSIVIGAGIETAVAHAQVIEMRRQDDPFILEDGIAAAQPCADVVADDGSRLFARDGLQEVAVEKRFELQSTETGRRGKQPPSRPLPRFGRRIPARSGP